MSNHNCYLLEFPMVKQTNTTGRYAGTAARGERPDSRLEKEATSQFPLGKKNFIMMGIAGLMIIVGFLLMLGGSSTEEAFNPDIFSTRRVVIGPTLSFLGFLFMGYAIIRRPAEKVEDDAAVDA